MAVRVAIGDIVLFKIDSSDFGISRPLLVTHVNDDDSVEGEIFFNWPRDIGREWPQKHLFSRLSKENRTVTLVDTKAARPGTGVGEWQFMPTPPISIPTVYDEMKSMRERLNALEAMGTRLAPIASKALVPEKRSR